MQLLDRLLIVGIGIGLIGASVPTARRMVAEANNRTVEITVDCTDVVELAGMSHHDLSTVFTDLKSVGVTSIAVYEDTLQSLQESGQASIRSGPDVLSMQPQSGTYFVTDNLWLARRVHDALSNKLAPQWGRRVPASRLMRLPLTEAQLKEVGFGFPEDLIGQIQAAGLQVVARPLTHPFTERRAIDYVAETCARLDMRTLVFVGSCVMGDRALIGYTADVLRRNGLAYGSVEMGKQLGDNALGRRLAGRIIRVHSIPQPEMMSMSPADAVARFIRGARERGIRLFYVRLFGRAATDAYGTELAYLRKLSAAVKQAGFGLGRARPPEKVAVPAPARVLVAIGTISCLLLLFRRLFPVSERAGAALLIIGLVPAGLLAARGDSGAKMLALLAAVEFPTLAVYVFSERLDALASSPSGRERPGLGALVARGVLWLLLCTGTTLIGAFYVAGLLGNTLFMTHVEQFAGVKLAHGLPLLTIAAVYALGLWRRADEPGKYWLRVRRTGRRFADAAVSNGVLILAVVVLAAAAVLIARSGNEPGLDVSAIELKLRQFLEDTLVARPRTKEFLVGHPLLVLSYAFCLLGWRRALPLCVMGGTVGQVSVVNTFCHIHTPLWFSLLRTANGLWLGALLGGVLLAAVYLLRRAMPLQAAPEEPSGAGVG